MFSWLAMMPRALPATSPNSPAFTVEIGLAIDAADRAIRIDDLLAHVVTHEIEAKTGDLVVAGPDLQRVDHQLGHHAVLAGGVLAAGRGFDRAGGGVAAVVVTGHDLSRTDLSARPEALVWL